MNGEPIDFELWADSLESMVAVESMAEDFETLYFELLKSLWQERINSKTLKEIEMIKAKARRLKAIAIKQLIYLTGLKTMAMQEEFETIPGLPMKGCA